jgi:uncharacterized protein YjdB
VTVKYEEKPVEIVSVNSVSLNKTELILKVGESETLIASILQVDASNKSVKWSSNGIRLAGVMECCSRR